jgi:CheY-like chemotaxis protein
MAAILLVDDDDAARDAIAGALIQLSHTITTAQNGRVAAELLATRSFDLLIVDVSRSAVDGLRTIHTVHQIASDVPIISISALSARDFLHSVGLLRG